MNDIVSPYAKEVTNVRLIVLTEIEPGSNKYFQIEMSRDEYMKVLDFLESSVCQKTGDEIAVPIVEGRTVVLPDIEPYRA
jgi:hypothetical protein